MEMATDFRVLYDDWVHTVVMCTPAVDNKVNQFSVNDGWIVRI